MNCEGCMYYDRESFICDKEVHEIDGVECLLKNILWVLLAEAE